MTNKEMLINVSEGEECRIALLEDGKLEELYMERSSSTSHVGNIYKGRVTNVEASIQAAFVDFGLGRNGFLHISDLMPTYFGRKGEDIQEAVGRKMARRDRPPIQRCLRRGDEIIVQIIKEGIGTKGPTLSTYLSIPGRILVMMPGMGKFGVSRKIEDEDERRRLRTILDSLKPIKDVGFIIRTAGVGKTKTDIQRDLTYLTRLWQTFEKKRKSSPAPVELYTEGDLVTRTVRDVFSTDIGRIVVDSKEVAKRVKDVIKLANPRTKNKVELYDEPIPLFSKYGIEKEIELMYSRHVPLPSGGSLVIDSTEAVVAIDVNSGKFRDHSDAETTAFKTDMEAADEIPRQLRLRDLGGVIICDFIDLRYERHRRELEGKLHDKLKNDRAKTKVLRMSQFGIIEMTRQRMRPSLKRSIYFDCPHCKGSGLVKTPESMSLDVMRRLAIAISDARVARVEMTVNPEVAFYLLNRKRQQLADLEERFKKQVIVREDIRLALDDVNLQLHDSRDGLVIIAELGMLPPGQVEDTRRRHQQGRRDGRGRDRRPQGGRPVPSPDREAPENEEERFDIDRGEEGEGEHREDSREDSHAEPREPDATPARGGRDEPAMREASSQYEDDDDAESSQVVEVDEPSEPMGEGPRAIDDRGERDAGPDGPRKRRRRGRRGRGGRGRGGQGPQVAPQQSQRAPASPQFDDETQPTEEDQPGPGNERQPVQQDEPSGDRKRRRRRRGGRRHRGRRDGKSDPAARTNGDGNTNDAPVIDEDFGNRRDERDERDDSRDERADRDGPRRPPPQRIPPRGSSHAPPPPVPRTGSTDSHLMNEDVVDTTHDPEPPRRPHNSRDLDAIPDDYEE